MQTPPGACSGRMVYLFALAWCLRNFPGIVPWWAGHHRRKVSTNVSQTSATQGIFSFRWELQGTWQMWPSSPYPVQLFYEWSIELSHNTTLGWTPGALSPAGVLRRDEWEEHKTVMQNFPCKPFRNLCTLPPLHPPPHGVNWWGRGGNTRRNIVGIWFGTSLVLMQMSTRDREQQSLMAWCLWLVLLSYRLWGDPFSDAFRQSVTAPHSSDGQQPDRNYVILAFWDQILYRYSLTWNLDVSSLFPLRH